MRYTQYIIIILEHVMAKSKSAEKWIVAGYERFAHEGPLGIQVERLARIIGLNKSGFYHYFGDHDTYITELINHHADLIHQFALEARPLKTFDPEYLQLVVKYKLTSMVQMQVGRNQKSPLFTNAFNDLNSTLSSVVAPLWADFINIPDNPELAIRYYQLVRNTLYANFHSSELNYDVLHSLAQDARVIAQDMIKRDQSSLSASYMKK